MYLKSALGGEMWYVGKSDLGGVLGWGVRILKGEIGCGRGFGGMGEGGT